MRLLSADAF